ncbi:MAG: UvrD-helicase domain-containing protein, partial [Verrucomicrobia bacterium]|nr:UvrD-helicase domain-containing protein [Verrucomicrobiota bacterium]
MASGGQLQRSELLVRQRESGLRIIVHKTAADILICHVNHHDKAYAWAEKRRLETHPRTGAIQLVEVRERVEEIGVHRQLEIHLPTAQQAPTRKPALVGRSEEELLRCGVPQDWVQAVLNADEQELLEVVFHLPQEAGEAVLDLALDITPQVAVGSAGKSGFDHPDAQRRFKLFTDEKELAIALVYPWEQWTVFLHPSQKRYVEQDYNGPARVTGSAGTGKTVVALHRAVRLARVNPNAQVLLTTFSPALADLLKTKLDRLVTEGGDIARRIIVRSLTDVISDLYSRLFGQFVVADDDFIRSKIAEAIKKSGSTLSPAFVWSEWRLVIDPWQVNSLDAYQTVPRTGRKSRLGALQRERVWDICRIVKDQLNAMGQVTWSAAFTRVLEALKESGERPYGFVVVDEAQDLGVAELRFLAVIGDTSPQALFFAGDGGQRIFQQPFSW